MYRDFYPCSFAGSVTPDMRRISLWDTIEEGAWRARDSRFADKSQRLLVSVGRSGSSVSKLGNVGLDIRASRSYKSTRMPSEALSDADNCRRRPGRQG